MIAVDTTHSATYTVTTCKSPQEVENLRPSWEALQRHPNADIDFYLTVTNERPQIIRPHVILLSENGRARTMLIGRIEDSAMDLAIGYKTMGRPRVRLLTIVQGGLLGDDSCDSARMLVDELLTALDNREAEAVLLSSLRIDTCLCDRVMKRPPFLLREHVIRSRAHWRMSLPDSIEAFYQSRKSKHRYWLRRLPRVLEKDFPGRVQSVCLQTPADVEKLCSDAEGVAKKTYQRGMGVGFVNDRESLHRLHLAASKHWLRAYVLYVAGAPSAFWIGSLYKDVFYLDYTGYDPELSRYEPGTVAFLNMIEDLCRHGVRTLDFGTGSALYKERFGDKSWEEASVYLFSRTLRGIQLSLLSLAANTAQRTLSTLVHQRALAVKIQKLWRRLLTPKNNMQGGKEENP